MRYLHRTISSVPIFSKDDCSKVCLGTFSVLSPSILPFQNTTLFLPLRNHILILSPSIARKTVGVESFVKRQDIFALVSVLVPDKKAAESLC